MTRYSFVTTAAVILALASPCNGQSFSPGGNLLIRDANGQLVGQYLDADNGAGVSVILNGHNVVLRIERQLIRDNGALLYFDQPNCQGLAYLSAPTTFPWPETAFAPDGTARIAASFNASPHTVSSSWRSDSQQCQNSVTVALPTLPTEIGPNVNALFTPPFTVTEGIASAAALPLNGPRFLMFLLLATATIGIIRVRATLLRSR